MLEITPQLAVDEDELTVSAIRASGPGGQNVNKVASAVQLRFDIRGSSLPADVQERLQRIAGRRITSEGILVIRAARFRSQERNRSDAIDRFVELVRRAAEAPAARQPTRPTRASRERRLEDKRQRSAIKRSRQARDDGNLSE